MRELISEPGKEVMPDLLLHDTNIVELASNILKAEDNLEESKYLKVILINFSNLIRLKLSGCCVT